MIHKLRIAFVFLALAVGFTLAVAVFPGLASPKNNAILYAAPASGGTGNCSSWENACILQTALASSVSGDQIWVKEGIYKPGMHVTDTFTLVDGVAVYGGFNGTETILEQRDWETNITVLSGDIDNNDITDIHGVVTDTDNLIGNNAYHVVWSSDVMSNTFLDGFIITGGFANGPYTQNQGGGLYNYQSNPTLLNITFIGNYAGSGGGMYNEYSSPLLLNLIFRDNQAEVGGGMSSVSLGSLSLYNVMFTHNTATTSGGALYIEINNTMLTHVTLMENTAGYQGGGIYNLGGDGPMNNVTFKNNHADEGGGLFNSRNNYSLTSVTFHGNTAVRGGAIYNSTSDPLLQNVLIQDNSATNSGGGIYNFGSDPWLINVTLSNNHAETGGGMYNSNVTLQLINCILWENTAYLSGAQLYNRFTESTISYSDIQGSGGSGAGWSIILGIDGGGNLDADPLFANAAIGDLHLDLASPVIDAGKNVALSIVTDFDGFPRFADIPAIPDTGSGTPPIIDMGAYEAFMPHPIYLPLTLQSAP